tara:strand:+ start:235 stop:369 length:135 start_codon:yes stop_codon:yes gene_type:complete
MTSKLREALEENEFKQRYILRIKGGKVIRIYPKRKMVKIGSRER